MLKYRLLLLALQFRFTIHQQLLLTHTHIVADNRTEALWIAFAVHKSVNNCYVYGLTIFMVLCGTMALCHLWYQTQWVGSKCLALYSIRPIIQSHWETFCWLGSALNKQLKFIYVILCIFRHNNKNIKSAKGSDGSKQEPLTAAAAVGFVGFVGFAFVIVGCHTKSFFVGSFGQVVTFLLCYKLL